MSYQQTPQPDYYIEKQQTYDPSSQQTYDPSSQQTYDPSPQQTYDPSPQYSHQQQPQYQYGAGATYQQVPGYQPPPQKKGMSGIMLVVTIVVIVIVVVAIVFSGLMFFAFSQPYSQGPGDDIPIATLVASTFSNPEEGSTNNAGGWSAQIMAITGKPPDVQDLTIRLADSSSVTISSMTPSGAGVRSGTSSTIKWYAQTGSGGTPKFWDYSSASTADLANNADIIAREFKTIENVYMVFLDNDGGGKLNAGDVIMVFKSNNGDDQEDVGSGSEISIMYKERMVAMTPLN